MKKKLSALLAVILTLCMTLPVMAAPSNYPTERTPADEVSTFTIEKKYVKQYKPEENAKPADKFPAETLKFKSECVAAPMELAKAPNLEIQDLSVTAVTSDITVTVPSYTVAGKYNYKITEISPATASGKANDDTAGVRYDETPVYIQVVVKYESVPVQTGTETKNEMKLVKYVTVTKKDAGIGNGNDQTQENANKKADFKNKYLLDGDIIDPGKPEPNPNPIPDPDPNKPDPDPVTPIPGPDGNKPDATEKAKFKVMKQVRGPLANKDQLFDIVVTLTSSKPVRSDITYEDKGSIDGTIKKVGEGSSWEFQGGQYKFTKTFQLKDNQTVVFSGIPADVSYTVKEAAKHIGKLDETTLNDSSKGYTVAYYGGNKVENVDTTAQSMKSHGEALEASGTIGVNHVNNIIVANSKGLNQEDTEIVKPNTGIRLDSLPYILILCAVVIVSSVMIVRSRRRREE